MKTQKLISGLVILFLCFFINTNAYAQFPMPNNVPNWLHFNFNIPNAYQGY